MQFLRGGGVAREDIKRRINSHIAQESFLLPLPGVIDIVSGLVGFQSDNRPAMHPDLRAAVHGPLCPGKKQIHRAGRDTAISLQMGFQPVFPNRARQTQILIGIDRAGHIFQHQRVHLRVLADKGVHRPGRGAIRRAVNIGSVAFDVEVKLPIPRVGAIENRNGQNDEREQAGRNLMFSKGVVHARLLNKSIRADKRGFHRGV